MLSSILASALITSTHASELVYRVGGGTKWTEYKLDPEDWKMVFRWPRTPGDWNAYRCTATMISPQVALTAAHCVREEDIGVKPW